MKRIAVSLAALLSLAFLAADWPQFRGPRGSAVSTETGLPTTWSASENIVWKTKLPGHGTSSPVVIGKRVYLTCYSGYGLDGSDPGDQSKLTRHVLSVNLANGKIAWQKGVKADQGEEPFQGFQALHGYASSTPAADGKGVYVFFGKSGVFAFDLKGKQLWRGDVGQGTHNWGSATSPLLYKELVIVNASVESGAIVALNKKNGKEAWRAEGSQSSWNTPILVDVGGKQELVVSVQGTIGGFDPDNGKPLWRCDGIPDYVCPSLVAKDGVVYAIGGRSAMCLAIKAGGRGDVTKSHLLWQAQAGSNVTSPVIHEGHLYWVSDEGVAHCLKADSGQIVYQERLDAERVYASAVAADGKLYIVSREDGAFVLDAAPRFKLLAHNDLSPDTSVFNAGPAVVNGQLLLRSDQMLYCIGEKK